MRHVLVVGGMGPSVQDTSGLGIEISMFQQRELVRPDTPSLVSRLYAFDYEDAAESVALAQWLHARHPLDAVISFTESGVGVAALVCERLGVAGNPPRAVQLSRDKVAMRELMLAEGIASTRFRRCADIDEARAFSRLVDGPVILKPVAGAGSEGVCFAADVAAIEAAWQRVAACAPAGILAEEFLVGPEYSVEALTMDGVHQVVAITEKLTTDAPYFIETGHQMPAELVPDAHAEIEAMVHSLLDAIGHRLGPSHTELRLTRDGPRVIETHTRPGGDFIPVLVKQACGIDLMRATLAHLGGVAAAAPEGPRRGSAIRFFSLADVTVTAISGIDVATAMPGVERVDCDVGCGDVIGPRLSSESRQGFVVASGDSVGEARERVERAFAAVRIDTVPAVQ